MSKKSMRIAFSLIIIITIELVFFVLALAAGGFGALFKLGFKSLFFKSLWVLAMPPILIVCGMIFWRNDYQLREVELTSEKIPAAFADYRMVQISDLHLQSYRLNESSLRKMVSMVNSLEPDLILFTGDLVTLTLSELNGMEDILRELSAKDGIYSVLGNHDYFYMEVGRDSTKVPSYIAELLERERGLGWVPLIDANVNISRGQDTISIVGVQNTTDSKHFPSKGNLGKALKGARGSYKILMSHDPSHWRMEVAADPRIDLMLSGHTHEAQARIFGISPAAIMYKQHNGLYSGPGHEAEARPINAHSHVERKPSEGLLYVNIGLGETGLPSRIGARPEITLFRLSP